MTGKVSAASVTRGKILSKMMGPFAVLLLLAALTSGAAVWCVASSAAKAEAWNIVGVLFALTVMIAVLHPGAFRHAAREVWDDIVGEVNPAPWLIQGPLAEEWKALSAVSREWLHFKTKNARRAELVAELRAKAAIFDKKVPSPGKKR